jgi:hypothetical protein
MAGKPPDKNMTVNISTRLKIILAIDSRERRAEEFSERG